MRRKKSSSSSSASMDAGDRQSSSHRSNAGGGGSELFICFTSRPSASSSAAAAPSLSASLSRRLKTSGSVKGAQSPMFSTVVGGRRNKGAAFETAEPTSPKVTCIGQVRVKGKQRRKKAKGAMLRSRSKRVVGSEASFRKGEGEMGRERECTPGAKNQGWVYQIPVSICDALKTVGSEFNCLVPCSGKSFCSSSSSGKGTGQGKVKRRGSCGAVLARWLMMQEDEETKRQVEEELEMEQEVIVMERKVEVVTDSEERRMVEEFEVEISKKEEILVVEEEEVEGGRVGVCIPPKNALLLMRCRSDPVRMAALANRLWGSPVRKVHAQEQEVEEEDEDENERVEEERDYGEENKVAIVRENEEQVCEPSASEDILGQAENTDLDKMQADVRDNDTVSVSETEEKDDLAEPKEESESLEDNNNDSSCPNESENEKDCNLTESQIPRVESSIEESHVARESKERKEEETKARRSTSCSPSTAKEEKKARQYRMRRQRSNGGGGSSSREKDSRRHSFSSEGDPRRSSFSSAKEARRSSFSLEGKRWSFSIEQDDIVVAKQTEPSSKGAVKKGKRCSPEPERDENLKRDEEKRGEKEKTEEKLERKLEVIAASERKKSGELPDCLLLMMYEPKLSMEVSKETWVRPTDFINWRAAHKRHNPPLKEDPNAKTENNVTGDDQKDTSTQTEETANPDPPIVQAVPPVQPSLDPPVVKGMKVELPIQAEVIYAPFVLKRCKSEPMRSSARLVADACFWKERHMPIGAVGF